MINPLPSLARQLCYGFDAWITGSAALDAANFMDGSVKDIDIVVPPHEWDRVGMFLAQLQNSAKFTLNTFGGWKISGLDGVQYDVFSIDFAKYMTYIHNGVAWHPKSGARWIKFMEKK